MKRLWCFALLGLAACVTPPPELGYTVLVSQTGSASVAIIDSSLGVTGKLEVGMLPHRMIVAGDAVYVVLTGSQAVAEIDARNLTVRRTMLTAPVPETRADSSRIAAHFDRDAFAASSCFSCHNAKPSGAKPAIVGTRPFGIALSEDAAQLIVSQIRTGDLSVLNRDSGQLERTVTLPPTGAAREANDVTRLGSSLYVSLRPSQPATTNAVIRRLDASTLEPLGESLTGADPAAIVGDEVRGRVLVTNFESNTVSAFNANGLQRTYTVAPGPLGALPLRDSSSVLVLNYYANSVSIVQLETGEVQTYPLEFAGRSFVNPTHAALTPDGRQALIVSSGTEGFLLTLDLETRRVTRAVQLEGLVFDIAVIPHRSSSISGQSVSGK
jgi:DNA-binding beta-propeller fold protein YncE